MITWISKEQPIYVFLDDCWLRETDKIIFYPDEGTRCWKSKDKNTIYWTKRTQLMKYRDIKEF